MADRDYEADVPLLRRTLREETASSVPMARITELYTQAVLSITRIRSDEINGKVDDLDMLPYYEGRRDALHSLLEGTLDV